MELRELVKKSHELHEQLKLIHAQEADLTEQLEQVESEIKMKLEDTGKDYESLTEEEFQLMMADLGDPMKLSVEIVYLTSDKQIVHEVQLSRGATIEDGIIMSGILEECADINLDTNKVGIHGIVKTLNDTLNDGDRIEIYRPITAKA